MATPERQQLEPAERQRQLDAAWRALGPAAMRFATALVGPHDAHDITTNAFLRVTRQQGWADIERLDRYLFRAVRNEANNLFRDRPRCGERDLRGAPTDPSSDLISDHDVLGAQSRATLRRVLRVLE